MSTPQTTHRNKILVRRIYEDCINTGQLERLAEMVGDDYVGALGEKGAAGFAGNIESLRKGFPDICFTIEDLIAEEDRVVVRWRWSGTHNGSFMGIPPSQKQVSNTGITVYQVKSDKVVHSWLQADRLGVLQQIGVIPPNALPKPQPK